MGCCGHGGTVTCGLLLDDVTVQSASSQCWKLGCLSRRLQLCQKKELSALSLAFLVMKAGANQRLESAHHPSPQLTPTDSTRQLMSPNPSHFPRTCNAREGQNQASLAIEADEQDAVGCNNKRSKSGVVADR